MEGRVNAWILPLLGTYITCDRPSWRHSLSNTMDHFIVAPVKMFSVYRIRDWMFQASSTHLLLAIKKYIGQG